VALVHALCPGDPEDVAEPTDTDWRVAVLAGQGLVELRLPQQIEEKRRQGEDVRIFQAELSHVRDWLVALVERGVLPPMERAAAGDALARLADPRPGVGLRPDGLPDILWCEVPAGSFIMGSDKAHDPDAYDDESPQHEQPMPYAYRISKYPVTNAQFAAFVQGGGYTNPDYWTKDGWQWREGNDVTAPETYGGAFDLPNHPVVMVSWYEALAFCRWLDEQLHQRGELSKGEHVTLPTEAEWEKAARGTDGRRYPWGDEPDPNRANYDETGIGTPSAVGVFPGGQTPYGCLDMSGNVWEWTRSLWGEKLDEPTFKYPYDPKDGREDVDAPEGVRRVLRGGAFYYDPGYLRCASRSRGSPLYRDWSRGFRVVVSPVISPLGSGNSGL
jgi:formylglycine-generating enzyme required for sulfatase activity